MPNTYLPHVWLKIEDWVPVTLTNVFDSVQKLCPLENIRTAQYLFTTHMTWIDEAQVAISKMGLIIMKTRLRLNIGVVF